MEYRTEITPQNTPYISDQEVENHSDLGIRNSHEAYYFQLKAEFPL